MRNIQASHGLRALVVAACGVGLLGLLSVDPASALSLEVQQVPSRLVAIDCLSPTLCLAVGPQSAVAIIDGRAGSQVALGNAGAFRGVGCTETTCVAVGWTTHRDEAQLMPIAVAANGNITPGASQMFQVEPGFKTYLNGIDCPSSTTCIAVGQRYFNGQPNGFAVPITVSAGGGISRGTPVAVPDSSQYVNYELYGVACGTPSTCVGAGDGAANEGYPQGAAVSAINGGSPSASQPVVGSGILFGVGCTQTGFCVAVGTGFSTAIGVIVPVRGGSPGAPSEYGDATFLMDAACRNSVTCYAVGKGGTVIPITTSPAFSTGQTQRAAGVTWLGGVACASANVCFAAGEAGSAGAIVRITEDADPPGSCSSSTSTSSSSTTSSVPCPTTTTSAPTTTTSAPNTTSTTTSTTVAPSTTTTAPQAGNPCAILRQVRQVFSTNPLLRSLVPVVDALLAASRCA